MHTALMVNCALNIKNNNMENPKGENLCNCGPETFLHGKTGTTECGAHTNKIKNLTPVKAVQDEAGHWYVIPMELQESFKELHAKALEFLYGENSEDVEKEFIDKFSKYRTGGDLNNKQLYAEL